MADLTNTQLVQQAAAGDRSALARLITNVESTVAAQREAAIEALHGANVTGPTLSVGLTGAPGAGKSTLINQLVHWLLDNTTAKVAVLTIDPSSIRSGGSILGDKTRMQGLSDQQRVFVRSTPTGGALGGVHPSTRHAIMCCALAGFDVVLVETVGVGQSEVDVEKLVDQVALLVAPGAGDDLQGAKRGVVEIADLVVVTKNDGTLAADAQRVAADYRDALHLVGRDVTVLTCSSVTNDGVDHVARTLFGGMLA
jgi:LAO/AO transport system kinase